MTSDFLDRIAFDNIDVIKNEKIANNTLESQLILSSILLENPNNLSKTAAMCYFERIPQMADIDFHQDVKTAEFWKISKNKIVRIVPKLVKG